MTTTTENLTAIPAAVVARSVRKELAQAFPGIKFKVSGSRSAWWEQEGIISISWTDGPTADKVQAVANKYQGISLQMDPYADIWTSERIANADGTYYAVGSVDTLREMSEETREGMIAKALELTGAADFNEFSTIVRTDRVPSALYSIFHSKDISHIPTMYNAWDFFRWAFNTKDVAAP